MKRASLTIAPAPPKTESPDLTDRLLAREPKPRRRAPRQPRKPKPTSSATEPAATISAPPLVQALAQSREAIAVLKIAAREAPARYDVALRYRLDALAHHLQQVVEFVESATRPPETL